MRISKHVHLRYGSALGESRSDETGYTLCGRDNSTVETISIRQCDESRPADLCRVCDKANDAAWRRAAAE